MKKILIVILLTFAVRIQAQERIGEAEAFATAESFLQQQAKQQSSEFSLNEIICSKESGQPNLFLYAMEPQGFVIVSAIGEVLAYSFESDFPASSELPSHINYWLELYNDRTDYLLQHPEQFKEPTRSTKAVEPLLTSCWGQGCYQNAFCPQDEHGPCGRVSAGCVAIAMAQIMYYHKQPINGVGSISYSCPHYGTLSANFGQTTYHWDEMADTLHRINPAVSQLVYHCGISVKTQYSAHQSSASNSNAANALRHFFSYPVSTLSRRTNYNDEEWLTMIMEDLDKQRPVYYSGSSSLGTHAFVCDGYDHNGLFHFNFGWDGVADGYYTLDSPYGFSNTQTIIHNICPIAAISINSDEHGIIYVASDGTGDGSSWAQATNDLQSAIFKAQTSTDSIWVKEGLYTGNPYDENAFLLFNRGVLYGGFRGDEPFNYDLSQRDFEAHPTILDGDQTQGVIRVDTEANDYVVIIDGFTIQNGNTLKGGGIYTNGNLHLRNCKLCFNHARTYGGGFLCNSIDKECCITNCTFSNNTANYGGGIASSGNETMLWNCLVSNNTATIGGGCHLNGGNLYNCTIVKNEAQKDYGGIYALHALNLQNCIVWGNVTEGENTQICETGSYSHCAIEGDKWLPELNFSAAAENDGEAPGFYIRFKDPVATAGNTGQGGDWRLQPNSLCIDRGISVSNQPQADLDGNPRLKHNDVDLGAYESNTVAHIIEGTTCEDDPFEYNGSILPDVGTYSFLYPGVAYDSLVILQLYAKNIIHLEETICIGDNYNFFGTILYETGHYSTVVGCDEYQLDLTVKTIDFISMEVEICEGETCDFFGTPLIETGHYSTFVDCTNYELNLTVNPLPTTVIHLEEDICEDESYDFFGTILYETGHYTTIHDCNSYELDLTVNPIEFLPMHEEICEGESYDFFGKQITKGGHYSTYFKFNCTSYELDLTVNPAPILRCSNDTIVEYGHPVMITTSGADTYLWSTGDTTQCITVFPKEESIYTVTGFSTDGCSATAKVKVQVQAIVSSEEMVLYPNPANDEVEIYMPLIDEVEIFNLLGEQVCHVEAHRKAVVLDASHYASGVYIVRVRHMKNYSYKKLVVNH
jgi:hypothetical protein